jgi:hypothetical protein
METLATEASCCAFAVRMFFIFSFSPNRLVSRRSYLKPEEDNLNLLLSQSYSSRVEIMKHFSNNLT